MSRRPRSDSDSSSCGSLDGEARLAIASRRIVFAPVAANSTPSTSVPAPTAPAGVESEPPAGLTPVFSRASS